MYLAGYMGTWKGNLKIEDVFKVGEATAQPLTLL
jgi:hypothetical protein